MLDQQVRLGRMQAASRWGMLLQELDAPTLADGILCSEHTFQNLGKQRLLQWPVLIEVSTGNPLREQ
ncbi:hypothetical protein D3C71_996110 [compost metagenome]